MRGGVAAAARRCPRDAPPTARPPAPRPPPFPTPRSTGGTFEAGDVRWFADGQLNACYNCVDRHVAAGRGAQTAIIFEADAPGKSRRISYDELLREVCKVASVLLTAGVRKGDTVAVYLPMIPDLAFVMLACARIGAVHSVIFAGFSADSVRDRLLDAACKWVVTADEGLRGGRTIPLKATVDAAVAQAPAVQKVFVYAHTGADVLYGTHDVRMGAALAAARPFVPAVAMDAEDMLCEARRARLPARRARAQAPSRARLARNCGRLASPPPRPR